MTGRHSDGLSDSCVEVTLRHTHDDRNPITHLAGPNPPVRQIPLCLRPAQRQRSRAAGGLHFRRDLMFIIMGHYFAARKEASAEIGPAPLYLPRGTIRSILLLGFAVLAGGLIFQHRLGVKDEGHVRLSHAGVTLILISGFMLGVLMSR